MCYTYDFEPLVETKPLEEGSEMNATDYPLIGLNIEEAFVHSSFKQFYQIVLQHISTLPPGVTAVCDRLNRYRYKAIRRYRAAHDDIMTAISKKDKALQKLFKKTDPAILLEMSEEAVTSSGMGIYRQSRTAVDRNGDPTEESSTAERQKERPGQLRQNFTQRLKV